MSKGRVIAVSLFYGALLGAAGGIMISFVHVSLDQFDFGILVGMLVALGFMIGHWERGRDLEPPTDAWSAD